LSKYLFDTNICIYYFRQFPPIVRFIQETYQELNHEKWLSVITEAELLSVKAVRADSGLKSAICEFIDDSDQVIEVSRQIAYLAGEVRSRLDYEEGKKIKLPDVLIAATAIHKDAILVSNNDKDFQAIAAAFNMKYVNPISDQTELTDFLNTQ
jgi:tRNA(fMet)-specific endonuclease VapC